MYKRQEFGGVLTSNDYVIIDREDTTNDGIFNQGEVIKVITPLVAEQQKFRISSDCTNGTDSDVFVVNSVTGDTTILGDTIINNSLTIKGGCGTISTIGFSGSCTSGSTVITNVSVTEPGKTLSDIKVGDYIRNITNESPIEFDLDTFIVSIDVAGNKITLNKGTLGSSTATVNLQARRNEKFTLTNGNKVPTYEVDTCTGTTHLGNHFGRIDVKVATSASGTTYTDTDITSLYDASTITKAYGYWFDPKTINAGGPDTTIRAAVAGSSNQIQIPVQTLGVGDGAFAVNDLVFVGTPTAASTGIGDFQIVKVVDVVDNDPANPTLVIGDPGDGLTTNIGTNDPNNAIYTVGNVVRRVLKHPEMANIIDVENRSRVNSGSTSSYVSLIIDRGYIVQQKLDYTGWLCLANDGEDSVVWAYVNGRLDGVVHQTTMNEQLKDGAREFRSGSLHLANNLRMTGGSFEIYDSVNKTRLFGFVNDDGHADHQGLFFWDAGVVARGDFYLFSAQDPENVIQNPDVTVPSFFVDNEGNVGAERSLTIAGVAQAVPSTTFKQFDVQNLGPNGTEEFAIKQDSSIDAFGYDNFYTSSGGRHTRYISSASPEEDLTLKANIVYMANVTASTTLILTLPSAPQTGDVVRVTDVGGNLSYNTSLVLRTPESSGTKIQGDNTGTLLGGRLTPYPSGELVVQTPNAAFALVYLGSGDSNGQVGIPTAVQGWWLTEV